jgi:hypothetical protein
MNDARAHLPAAAALAGSVIGGLHSGPLGYGQVNATGLSPTLSATSRNGVTKPVLAPAFVLWRNIDRAVGDRIVEGA